MVGWWPSHPVEPIDGAMVSNHFQTAFGPPDQPWPMAPGTVYPPRLAETLAELRLNPNELEPEQVLPFVPRAAAIDQEQDPRLATDVKAPSGDRAEAITQTVTEFNYNLARAYTDADRDGEAVPLLKDLYAAAPDQYRFGIQLAMCYRSLGETRALRALVERLTEDRSAAAKRAQSELADMVAALRAEQAEPTRPGLFIQIGEALLKLHRPSEAEGAFRKALALDPINPHARLGLARALLPQPRAAEAAEAALETVRLLYRYPLAHYVLGLALIRLNRFRDAEHALRVAVEHNPNFLAAHRVLVRLYTLVIPGRGDRLVSHQQLMNEIRGARRAGAARRPGALPPLDGGLGDLVADGPHPAPAPAPAPDTPPVVVASRLPGSQTPAEFVTVVAGLPRSGTSMLMQMVDAGGIPALTDGRRAADRDNLRGYFELEAATRLHTDKTWLAEACGRCVKIVAQLLTAQPRDRAYRVLFIERDSDEVLGSQRLMLERLGRESARLDAAALRRTYGAQLARLKTWLAVAPNLCVLYLRHREVLHAPGTAAQTIDAFLGGGLDRAAMIAAVDGARYRQRAAAG